MKRNKKIVILEYYRAKFSLGEVTKYFASDENFSRRSFPDKEQCKIEV